MPEHGFEDVGFAPELMSRCGGHANALSVDHFAHHAARAVGRANQRLRLFKAESRMSERSAVKHLGCGDLLQAAKESIAAGIRPR